MKMVRVDLVKNLEFKNDLNILFYPISPIMSIHTNITKSIPLEAKLFGLILLKAFPYVIIRIFYSDRFFTIRRPFYESSQIKVYFGQIQRPKWLLR